MKPILALPGLAILLGAAPLAAQAPKAPDDPLARFLFAPDLVLKHSQEFGLQPAQRGAIVAAIKEAQGDLLDLQLEMADRAGALAKLLERPRVDESAVLAQVDKVLGLERDVKRRQMMLLVRIKNALTKAQQEFLRDLRERGSDGEGLN